MSNYALVIILVLCALLAIQAWAHRGELNHLAVERQLLVNKIIARGPRDLAAIQAAETGTSKVRTPKPFDPEAMNAPVQPLGLDGS